MRRTSTSWATAVRRGTTTDDSPRRAQALRHSDARDPEHLIHRGDTGARRADAVVEQRAHSLRDRHGAQLLGAAPPLHLEPKLVVHHEQLVDAGASAVARPAALVAPLAFPRAREADRFEIQTPGGRLVGARLDLAMLADHAHESLR